MSDTKSFYLHTLTGIVEELEDDLASSFPQFLKKVEAGSKSFVVGMFKPGTVEDFDSSYRKKEFTTTDDPEESTAPAAVAITDEPDQTPAPAGEADAIASESTDTSEGN